MIINSCKLVLLGDSSVGKSSIVNRFVSDSFNTFQESTIGAAFLSKDIINDKDEAIRLEIWDTAGQERYRSLAPMYYRCAKIALVIYDVTSNESFEGAVGWINELNEKNETCNIYLIGNKIDLLEDYDNTLKNKVKEYCKNTNIKNFFLSAKSDENVKETFDYICNSITEESFFQRKIIKLNKDKPRDSNYYYYCCI
jgi:Ras-related protein Rab-5C